MNLCMYVYIIYCLRVSKIFKFGITIQNSRTEIYSCLFDWIPIPFVDEI